MFKISDTHYAATWLLHPSAPKISPPKPVLDRIARMKAQTASAAQNAGQSAASDGLNANVATDMENAVGVTDGQIEKEPAAKPVKRKPAKSAKSVKADDGDKAEQKPPKAKKPAASKPAASKPAAKKPATSKPAAKKPTAKKEKVTEKDGNGGTGNGK